MMILIGNTDTAKSLLLCEKYSSYNTVLISHTQNNLGYPQRNMGNAPPGFWLYQNTENCLKHDAVQVTKFILNQE